MKSQKLMRLVAAVMLLPICLGVFAACSDTKIKSQKISQNKVAYASIDTSVFKSEKTARAVANFAADLFSNNAVKQDNALLSPLSAYLCLAMLANGAGGTTLEEMKSVLGLGLDEINLYCANLYARINESKELSEYVSTFNSIWYNDFLNKLPKPDFLDVNTRLYGADLFRANFEKIDVCNDVNNWVSKNTDGMIKKLLEKISEDCRMLLVNTLLFKSPWETNGGYSKRDVQFTAESGNVKTVDGFYAYDHNYYFSENFEAFRMKYKANGIAFYGILPREDGKYGGKDVDFDSVIAAFDGNELYDLLNTKQDEKYLVRSMTPCFKYEFGIELTNYFKKGMPSAFDDWGADFSNMYEIDTNFNVYVDQIFQRAAIELDEKGTKAAAATAVIICDTKSAGPQECIEVNIYLDRPFIYLIVDELSGMPLFIGSVRNI